MLWPAELDALRAETRTAVDAGFAAMLEAYTAEGRPPTDPLERARAQRARFERTYVTVPEAISTDIAGVPCRVFRPASAARGVYLHFHGGGMILGAAQMNDIGNLRMATRFGLAVVSVDYRLAPEHPFPAGPDDGVAVAAWLLDHAAREFGTSRILVGGESAGGYMAAAVTLRIRDELAAVDRIGGVNLVFGVYDWGRSPSQRGIRPSTGPDMLNPEGIEFFADCYLPGRSDDARRHPQISPAFADLRGLPPALMSVGTSDHLLDDTLVLAARWAAAGNDVESFVGPELPHGFTAFPCELTRRWLAQTDAWFDARLTGGVM